MNPPEPAPRPPRPEPRPDLDPERVTNTRSDSDLVYRSLASQSPPERDPSILTESRGEAGSNSMTPASPCDADQETSVLLEANLNDGLNHETRHRGEDDGELTHTRGETPSMNDTGTFSRGESDDDLRPFAIGYDPFSTETKRDRGDADFDAAAAFDPGLDDPSDERRVTPLGLLAARQRTAAQKS
jgi:hypothetical protein